MNSLVRNAATFWDVMRFNMVDIYHTTRYHIQENCSLHNNHCENHTSHNSCTIIYYSSAKQNKPHQCTFQYQNLQLLLIQIYKPPSCTFHKFLYHLSYHNVRIFIFSYNIPCIISYLLYRTKHCKVKRCTSMHLTLSVY